MAPPQNRSAARRASGPPMAPNAWYFRSNTERQAVDARISRDGRPGCRVAAAWATKPPNDRPKRIGRSEEHTSELQSLMRISYAVFCLKKNTHKQLQMRR